MARLPFLRRWFRTRSAIILHLSNGTLPVSSFCLLDVHTPSCCSSSHITHHLSHCKVLVQQNIRGVRNHPHSCLLCANVYAWKQGRNRGTMIGKEERKAKSLFKAQWKLVPVPSPLQRLSIMIHGSSLSSVLPGCLSWRRELASDQIC